MFESVFVNFSDNFENIQKFDVASFNYHVLMFMIFMFHEFIIEK